MKKQIRSMVFILCSIMILTGCNSIDNNKDIINPNNTIEETEVIQEKWEYETVSGIYQSEDEEITAQIIRQKDE